MSPSSKCSNCRFFAKGHKILIWLLYALALLLSRDNSNRDQPSISYDGPVTPCLCTGPNLCFTRQETNYWLEYRPSNCTACVLQACDDASVDRSDLKAFRTCISDARAACPCGMATSQQVSRIQRCRTCVDQCDKTREATCQSFCSSPTLPCLTPDQLANSVIRQPPNCRECIRNRCVFPSSRSPADINDCMYDALADCTGCSLTAADRRQMNECTRCKTRCLSRPGAFESPES